MSVNLILTPTCGKYDRGALINIEGSSVLPDSNQKCWVAGGLKGVRTRLNINGAMQAIKQGKAYIVSMVQFACNETSERKKGM